MVCSCPGAVGHGLGFALQLQGEASLLSDAVTAPLPCSARGGGAEDSWAVPAPSLSPCRQLSRGAGG